MIALEDFNQMKQSDNLFIQSLVRPIQERCGQLSVLLDRCSTKDLQIVFPVLIDNIFGPNGTICWELRSITPRNGQDYQTLQHFLSPQGPLFKSIYALLKDPHLKFEFSLSYLPLKIRQSLDGVAMHPFYSDLLHVNSQSNHVVSLMLNPFDYYIFHFAYHLINPYHQRSFTVGCAVWDTIYYSLCSEYILHFLPTDPNQVVLPILNFYNGKNPTYTMPSFNKLLKPSRLFRTETVNVSKIQSLEHHPRNDIWRSETITTVLIDMWFSNDQVLCAWPNFDNKIDSTFTYHKQKLYLNELPTGEYIRILRMFVKHLHAFSASAKVDDTHMGELKKIVIPYIQGRVYIFLRHLVYRWPLDGSFRLVLELWLSFIQPWRYSGNEYMRIGQKSVVNPDLEEIAVAPMKAVDRENIQFLAENLLTYTVILQQLLPRFLRVDLSSPKIALILYRLTKVFAQPNLVSYIREIEECAEDLSGSPLHTYTTNLTSNLPPLSPTFMWSTNFLQNTNGSCLPSTPTRNLNDVSYTRNPRGKWNTLLKERVLELEGLNFAYKPIFYAEPAPEIYELISYIHKSMDTANYIIKSMLKEKKQKEYSSRFLNAIMSFLNAIISFLSYTDKFNKDFTLEERRKVPIYLQYSEKYLAEIFNINNEKPDVSLQQSQENCISPTYLSQNDISYLLTPERVRERMKKIKCEGDPDLKRIRSDEIKILVRLLYQLSQKINEDFGGIIQNLYHQKNFPGKFTRQLVQPPITVYKYEKLFPGYSPRIPQNLPPRLSLRYFASKKFVFYVVVTIIFSKLFGYGYGTFICVAGFFWFLYICLKALCDTGINNPDIPTLDLDDSQILSSNESF